MAGYGVKIQNVCAGFRSRRPCQSLQVPLVPVTADAACACTEATQHVWYFILLILCVAVFSKASLRTSISEIRAKRLTCLLT